MLQAKILQAKILQAKPHLKTLFMANTKKVPRNPALMRGMPPLPAARRKKAPEAPETTPEKKRSLSWESP